MKTEQLRKMEKTRATLMSLDALLESIGHSTPEIRQNIIESMEEIDSELKNHVPTSEDVKCPECIVGNLKKVDFTHYCEDCGHPN